MSKEIKSTPNQWQNNLKFVVYKDLIPCITDPNELYTEKELEELIVEATGKEEEQC